MNCIRKFIFVLLFRHQNNTFYRIPIWFTCFRYLRVNDDGDDGNGNGDDDGDTDDDDGNGDDDGGDGGGGDVFVLIC